MYNIMTALSRYKIYGKSSQLHDQVGSLLLTNYYIILVVCNLTRHTGIVVALTPQYGWSALMFAAMRGHNKVVAQLLEAGANTDLLPTEVHNTCMCG